MNGLNGDTKVKVVKTPFQVDSSFHVPNVLRHSPSPDEERASISMRVSSVVVIFRS